MAIAMVSCGRQACSHWKLTGCSAQRHASGGVPTKYFFKCEDFKSIGQTMAESHLGRPRMTGWEGKNHHCGSARCWSRIYRYITRQVWTWLGSIQLPGPCRWVTCMQTKSRTRAVGMWPLLQRGCSKREGLRKLLLKDVSRVYLYQEIVFWETRDNSTTTDINRLMSIFCY